ncbi:MAG TPA: acyl carrier protein [Rhizomicrobium sp.]|jgi:acyl carrier protein|nr:acyl carrier protein [Rhizomicrobium sp.]
MRAVIVEVCEAVAAEQEKKLAPLADDLPLSDSGLDSLCLAIIVARLEDAFGFDPFNTEGEIVFPVTFGEFVSFYENAAAAAES